MKKYKTLMSFSFRDYGESAGVWHDGCKVPICMGCSRSPADMATYCRSLAAYLLEMAHNYDNANDFTFPKFDEQARLNQLEKVADIMKPIFESEE